MFLQWAEDSQQYGLFSLRGVIPCVFVPSNSSFTHSTQLFNFSYLSNGNVQAAKTFIKHFTAGIPRTIVFESNSSIPVGEHDEVVMTNEPLVNFSQMAVLTCQRAQGEQSKVMRESWVRLSGTYQGKVELLATPEMRKVYIFFIFIRCLDYADILSLEVPERNRNPLLRHSTPSESGDKSSWGDDVVTIWWTSADTTEKKGTCTCLAIRYRLRLEQCGEINMAWLTSIVSLDSFK